MITVLSLSWLLPCALWDWRTLRVPNWLVGLGLLLALVFRLAGMADTPLWLVLMIFGIALGLWYFNQMGGADAKGWLVFALLGTPVLLGAALGMLLWFLLVKWLPLLPEGATVPGYPGYFLGVALVFLLQVT